MRRAAAQRSVASLCRRLRAKASLGQRRDLASVAAAAPEEIKEDDLQQLLDGYLDGALCATGALSDVLLCLANFRRAAPAHCGGGLGKKGFAGTLVRAAAKAFSLRVGSPVSTPRAAAAAAPAFDGWLSQAKGQVSGAQLLLDAEGLNKAASTQLGKALDYLARHDYDLGEKELEKVEAEATGSSWPHLKAYQALAFVSGVAYAGEGKRLLAEYVAERVASPSGAASASSAAAAAPLGAAASSASWDPVVFLVVARLANNELTQGAAKAGGSVDPKERAKAVLPALALYEVRVFLFFNCTSYSCFHRIKTVADSSFA